MRQLTAFLSALLICGCAGKPATVKKVAKVTPAPMVRPAAVFNPGSSTVSTPPAYNKTAVVDPAASIPLIPLETAPALLDSDKTKVSGSVSVSVGHDKVNSRVDRIGRAPITGDSVR